MLQCFANGLQQYAVQFVIYRLPVTRLDRQVYNDSKIYLHFRMQIVTHHLAYQVLSTLHGPGGSQGLTGLSSALTAAWNLLMTKLSACRSGRLRSLLHALHETVLRLLP